jgi:hypothetical protein
MKKNVLVFGLISGLIITTMMVYSVSKCYAQEDFEGNDVLGYTAMIAAFSFIFVGIRNYRNKYNGGIITFKKAFSTGLLITLVASTVYVGVWLIDFYVFVPDFMDKYVPHVMKQLQEAGATPQELEEKATQMASMKEMYKNPLFVVLISYAEVFPIGLIISLISALILKRKSKEPDAVATT